MRGVNITSLQEHSGRNRSAEYRFCQLHFLCQYGKSADSGNTRQSVQGN
jgi:hypothetical protein